MRYYPHRPMIMQTLIASYYYETMAAWPLLSTEQQQQHIATLRGRWWWRGRGTCFGFASRRTMPEMKSNGRAHLPLSPLQLTIDTLPLYRLSRTSRRDDSSSRDGGRRRRRCDELDFVAVAVAVVMLLACWEAYLFPPKQWNTWKMLAKDRPSAASNQSMSDTWRSGECQTKPLPAKN